ncbi:hypothetical protein [Nitratireductor soli]|uniref:hypothetical protein n=1 Tax=Nitratireductor soli TaxID=1670619 RepID=UPI0009E6295F|nr:hypothetical protein [Nitratireductor soli]
MTSPVTKHNLFKPTRPKAETKSETTNSIARAIIDAEAESREAKTLRLKKARLAMEAKQPAPAPAKTRAKKASKPKSTPSAGIASPPPD